MTADTPFPGLEHIFVMSDPLLNRYFRASFEQEDYDLVAKTGYNLIPKPEEPIQLVWGMGGRVPSDVVWPMAAKPPFVSSKVVELLHSYDITGWDICPTQITDRNGELHTNYHRLMIVARCGPIDWTKGERFWHTEHWRAWAYRGGWFDPESWEGSDLFCPVNSGFILASERVVNVCQRAKIRNLLFQRLTEHVMAESTLRIRGDLGSVTGE